MSKKILSIEDNAANMLLISRIVEAEGHALIMAKDGITGLELLRNANPDLIFLDINIPGINGLDVAREIRANTEFDHIPVVAITANVLVGDKERCLEAGCNHYMPKPLDIRKLRELMRSYLSEEAPPPTP